MAEAGAPFSVLILTLNEEADLPRCLESVAGCDDIVVLDSGSKDGTPEIARAAGARVFERTFDTFAGQRNFAQREIPFRHRWVFHLDADERFTPALMAECATAARRENIAGFYVAPRMQWRGRWIPHCTDFPAYQARFARIPDFEFVEVGHGQRERPGTSMAWLQEGYLHDLSSGGTAEWLEKHRRYARAEAKAHLANAGEFDWRELFSPNALVRRRTIKRLSFQLPARPLLRFIYQYALRRGFLDGASGWEYCRLLARYEGFIATEIRALKKSSQGSPQPS
jgi:glycosyltransferase involved in cell wall biosynthesis